MTVRTTPELHRPAPPPARKGEEGDFAPATAEAICVRLALSAADYLALDESFAAARAALREL